MLWVIFLYQDCLYSLGWLRVQETVRTTNCTFFIVRFLIVLLYYNSLSCLKINAIYNSELQNAFFNCSDYFLLSLRQVFYMKDYWVSVFLFSIITSHSGYQWLKFCFCVRRDTAFIIETYFHSLGNLLVIYYLHERSFNNHHNFSQMSSGMTSCTEWGQTRKQIINSLNIRKCVSTLWTQRGIFNTTQKCDNFISYNIFFVIFIIYYEI